MEYYSDPPRTSSDDNDDDQIQIQPPPPPQQEVNEYDSDPPLTSDDDDQIQSPPPQQALSNSINQSDNDQQHNQSKSEAETSRIQVNRRFIMEEIRASKVCKSFLDYYQVNLKHFLPFVIFLNTVVTKHKYDEHTQNTTVNNTE